MTRPANQSATSAIALGAAATPARLSAGALGNSASKAALADINQAIGEMKALAVQPLLQGAVEALNRGDYKGGGALALQALERDERNGFGWYLLAISREAAGDFAGSITCYESALGLLPDHAEIANNLGRLAFRLGQSEVAEKLFRHFLLRFPNHHEGANNLACALRDQGRFDEAIDVLKACLTVTPQYPMVWNTLGTVLAEQGDATTAQIFFDQALTLQPDFPKARYNRGNMHLALGDAAGAFEDCQAALKGQLTPDERQMMLLARSTIRIALGQIGEGWDDYEARLHPDFADVTHFVIDRPRWEPGTDLAGKSLLVIGEQGLGDEILFANILEDLQTALGPDGKLTLAVEARLVGLFQTSFPKARVMAHATFKAEGRTYRTIAGLDEALIDLWTPLASPLRSLRRTVESFPDRDRYMAADPARVAHWKQVLETAPVGRKVGLLWKSAVTNGARHRFFSPFDQWAEILATPGISFINLQYGDCSAELAHARDVLGVEIWTPPGIDLKNDLEEVAALSCALDLVLGFANATLNIAAACGAPTWLISTPGAWPRLGTDRYPWYPQARTYVTPQFGAWDEIMGQVAADLTRFAGDH